jgi:hypothetical protein
MTYSNTIALGRKTAVYGRGQNTTTFRTKERTLGPITSTITLIIMALVLGLFYLAQVTKTNAYGYQINSLREEQSRLDAQHDELAVASARLQSVERVATSDQAKSLVSVAPSATVRQ